MKFILVIAILLSTLGGCAIVPLDYGYRGDNHYRGDYHRNYHGDDDYRR